MHGTGIRKWSIWSVTAGLAVVLASTPHPVSGQQQGTRYELAPTGNEARYRVREQFLNVNFPNDAVGTTSAIKGGIVLDAAGKVIPAQSGFVVDVSTLKSDQETRDRVVRERALETAKFPTVDVGIDELRNYKTPWTADMKFEIVGSLTVHGVKKPWTWQVTASPKEQGLAGRATTAFKFGEFGMTVPTSMRLLSVDDNIRLEYDFFLVPAKP